MYVYMYVCMINELRVCALNSRDCHVNVMILTPRIITQFVYFEYIKHSRKNRASRLTQMLKRYIYRCPYPRTANVQFCSSVIAI